MPCPDNRNLLIIDEPAAEIVRRIFALSLSGYSEKKIAEILTAEGVVTPGVYKYQQGDTRFARYLKDGKSRWCYETVQTILKDQVYVGDMVNHKERLQTTKPSNELCYPKASVLWLKIPTKPLLTEETGWPFSSLSTQGIKHRTTILKTYSEEWFSVPIVAAVFVWEQNSETASIIITTVATITISIPTNVQNRTKFLIWCYTKIFWSEYSSWPRR